MPVGVNISVHAQGMSQGFGMLWCAAAGNTSSLTLDQNNVKHSMPNNRRFACDRDVQRTEHQHTCVTNVQVNPAKHSVSARRESLLDAPSGPKASTFEMYHTQGLSVKALMG